MFLRLSKYLLLAFLLFLPLFQSVKAADLFTENYLDKYDKEFDQGQNLNPWKSQATAVDIGFLFRTLTGKPVRDANGKISGFNMEGSVAGSVSSAIASAHVQPISGTQYIASLSGEILGKPALAQTNGYGFTYLQPILPIWKIFRNLVYMLVSVAFILLGLAIIFKIKINPQTIVSIQTAIPSIISVLLFTTFSYAIAGLILDLMTFVQALVLAMLFAATGRNLTGDGLFTNALAGGTGSWLGLGGWGSDFTFTKLMTRGLANIYDLSVGLISRQALISVTGLLWAPLGAFSFTPDAGGLQSIGSFLNGVIRLVGGLTGGVVLTVGQMALMTIMMVVSILYQMRYLFGLIKVYVFLIFKIIMAPFEIVAGIIPGSKMGFSAWLSEFFAYAMVFPVSFLFLVIANLIIDNMYNGLWVPNIIDATNLVNSYNFARFAVGWGALMLVAQLPELIPQIIFSIKPSGWETAIGKASANVPIVSQVFGISKKVGTELASEGIKTGVKAVLPKLFSGRRPSGGTNNMGSGPDPN